MGMEGWWVTCSDKLFPEPFSVAPAAPSSPLPPLEDAEPTKLDRAGDVRRSIPSLHVSADSVDTRRLNAGVKPRSARCGLNGISPSNFMKKDLNVYFCLVNILRKVVAAPSLFFVTLSGLIACDCR